jgi:hypothetical protein
MYADDLVLASHAYSLLGLHMFDTKRYVILRNPYNENWGFIYGKTNYSISSGPLIFRSIKDAKKGIRYNRPLLEIRNSALLPIHGVFAMELKDFVYYFAGFSWVIPS